MPCSFAAPSHELLALLRHLLLVLLAHRAAQQIGAAERVAGEHLRGLHDLLLIDEDAVGFRRHVVEQRVRRLDLRLALLALDVIRDQVHRARPIEREERVDVLDVLDVELPADADHAAGFQLEHADRLAAVAAGRRSPGRRAGSCRCRSPASCWRISATASVMTVSVFSPRKSIFSMPRSVSGPIAYWVTIEPSLARVSGMYSDRSRSLMTTPAACTPTPRVRPSSVVAYSHSCAVAGSFSTAFFSSGFLSIAPAMCSICAGFLVLLVEPGERDAEFVRDHLGDAIRVAVAPAEHAAHVAHHGLRAERAEGDDLRDRALAVFLPHVVDDLAAAVLTQKSTSMSGGVTRSGLRKRSKSSLNLIGSMSVMPIA